MTLDGIFLFLKINGVVAPVIGDRSMCGF